MLGDTDRKGKFHLRYGFIWRVIPSRSKTQTNSTFVKAYWNIMQQRNHFTLVNSKNWNIICSRLCSVQLIERRQDVQCFVIQLTENRFGGSFLSMHRCLRDKPCRILPHSNTCQFSLSRPSLGAQYTPHKQNFVLKNQTLWDMTPCNLVNS